VTIGNGGAGLKFTGSINLLEPWTPSSNSGSDGAIDIGYSGGRFKDLYLSGGVVFNVAGGTGTSTSGTLDDYEEGTFTATLTSAVAPTSPPTTSGRYTKIGRSVTISIFLEDGDTSGGSGVMRIDGLPFEAGAAVGNRGSGPVQFYNMTFSGDYCVAEAASTSIYFRSITRPSKEINRWH
jgi:hypothetical protein